MAASLEVVCPVRNGGTAFRDTLLSLTAQALPGCALLISDNYSTDGNPWADVLPRLAEWRLRVVRPPTELGRVEHWSWAFAQSDAEIVKPMMAGDSLAPDYIATVLSRFAAGRDLSLVFCQNRILEAEKEHVSGPAISEGPIHRSAFLELTLATGNFIGTLSGVAFRGDMLRAALPFVPEYPWTADWRLYTRCVASGPCYYIDRPLCVLNRRIARLSSRPSSLLTSLREEWRYLGELSAQAPGSKLAHFWGRLRLVGFQAVVKVGRVALPQWVRKPLGACYRRLAAS